MPTATLLIGLPGVGKTTYALKNLSGVRISSDDFIEQKAVEEEKSYHEVFVKYINEANEFFFDRLQRCIRNDFTFYCDRTFITRASRKRVLDMIPEHYTVEMLSFDRPSWWKLFHDLNERAEYGKYIPRERVKEMAKRQEKVSKSERRDVFRKISHYSSNKFYKS